MKQELEKKIRDEVALLSEIDDCVGIEIRSGKCLFIQVVDYGEGKEYLVELNDIDSDGAYTPCVEYNASSAFGDIDLLLAIIKNYLICTIGKSMIYTSKRGKQIVFDDYEDNTEEYHSYWAEICPHCHNKYKRILGNRAGDGAMGTCSVKGCFRKANYYVDFSETEVDVI